MQDSDIEIESMLSARSSYVDFCDSIETSLNIRGSPPYSPTLPFLYALRPRLNALEIVFDFSTDSFLLAIQRFVGHRGRSFTATTPLGALCKDPIDGEALTPGQLLIGGQLIAQAGPAGSNVKAAGGAQYQAIQVNKPIIYTFFQIDILTII